MRPRPSANHRHFIVLAVLFWLVAVWRFLHANQLHSLYVDILDRGIQRLKHRGALRAVRVNLRLGSELDGRLRSVSTRVKLDGNVISRSEPTLLSRRTLSVEIPTDATGILEIDVVGLDTHRCVVAGGAFEQRLDDHSFRVSGADERPSLWLSLRPLLAPLCD